jgi:hypothetical protein
MKRLTKWFVRAQAEQEDLEVEQELEREAAE